MELEYHNGNVIAVEGRTPPNEIPPNRTTKRISPGLFAAQGTRLIVGRDVTWDDVFGRRRVAIVSENMARENWGEPRNALGKRIRTGREGPWTEVVGVAENVHEDGVDRPAPPTVYFRAGVQMPGGPGAAAAVGRGITLAVRSNRAGMDSFLREIAVAIHTVNSSLPLAKTRTLNDIYRASMARRSFTLVLLGISGAMALTIAIVGVYGVLAYAVTQRRREVSIRVALGVEPGAVKALFIRHGLKLACAGSLMGLFSAAALSRWISSLLFGVAPLDPATYIFSGAIILSAAMVASYIPARRAASVDPMETRAASEAANGCLNSRGSACRLACASPALSCAPACVSSPPRCGMHPPHVTPSHVVAAFAGRACKSGQRGPRRVHTDSASTPGCHQHTTLHQRSTSLRSSAPWMPCSTLSWGITFTRRPGATIWSRTLRLVCRDGVPPSQGKQSVP